MPNTGFPPDTREEIDEFFSDVLRAHAQSVLHDLTSKIQGDQQDSGADVAQVVPNNRCSCCYCEARRRPNNAQESKPGDLRWFDKKLRHSFAIGLAAQRHHSVFVYLTPQGWMEWYAQLFSAIIGISVLGAGSVQLPLTEKRSLLMLRVRFTFSVIFNDFKLPDGRERYSPVYVRGCLAASWMLFVISIGVTSFAALMISVNKTVLTKALEDTCYSDGKYYHSPLLIAVTISTLLVELLPIGAFLASAEAVRAYHNGIGIATWATVSLIGLVMFVLWVAQNSETVRGWFGLKGANAPD